MNFPRLLIKQHHIQLTTYIVVIFLNISIHVITEIPMTKLSNAIIFKRIAGFFFKFYLFYVIADSYWL